MDNDEAKESEAAPNNEAFTPQEMFDSRPDAYEQKLDTGRPAVAASPTRVFIVLGGMGIILLYLLYSIFFSGGPKKDNEDIKARQVATNISEDAAPAPPPPLEPEELPEPPELTPPSIPEPTQLPEINQEQDNANNKALLDRLKSNMLIVNNAGGLFGGDSQDTAEDELAALDPNTQFGRLVTRSNTKAPKVTATQIGDLRRIIAQGRLIHGTLETAINTDLPGPIRAVVSRDVYGEAGNAPLIPQGSRLIGEYSSNIIAGQSRVYVIWKRVIRPDGVDVALGSPLIDQIGQAGVGGYVDNKFRELFSRAVLASVFSIAVAYGVEAIENPKTANSGGGGTTNIFAGAGGGSSSSNGTSSEATINALNRIGSLTTSFITKFLNVKPTILVDQGTPVMVFVNRDLIFPAELVGARVIP